MDNVTCLHLLEGKTKFQFQREYVAHIPKLLHGQILALFKILIIVLNMDFSLINFNFLKYCIEIRFIFITESWVPLKFPIQQEHLPGSAGPLRQNCEVGGRICSVFPGCPCSTSLVSR